MMKKQHSLMQTIVRCCTTILLVCLATSAWGQRRIHFDVDYHYNLGVVENFMGTKLHRDDYSMGGHSLHLAARYDVAPRWSAGLGIGLDRYTEPDYNTMPVYATVRFAALPSVPSAYAFADLGYALGVGDYTKGFAGALGVGYTYMIAKHFGLNFQLAYNLKKFEDIPLVVFSEGTDAPTYSEAHSTRHSISFGIGVTF